MGGILEMSNCPFDLKFSSHLSEKRLQRAFNNLGGSVVHRIIGFTLFLLGAKRENIAKHLGLPLGTFLSFLTRIEKYGLIAFKDRRKADLFQLKPIERPPNIFFTFNDQQVTIQLGPKNQALNIPRNNLLQLKVVLLTFFNSGLLSAKEIAGLLGLSERHIRELNSKMHEQDALSLVDKRKGQLQEYRFSPEVKAQLVQQFAAHAITGKPTSSHVIAEQLSQRCNIDLPARSVRFQVNKLGLSQIRKSLPDLVETLKKTPVDMFEVDK